MVFVLTQSKEPLMPCENVIARFLLKSGKAKVIRREPFIIKLTRESTKYVQPYTIGVDSGSKIMGLAVADKNGKVIYKSEIILRDDIKIKMDKRRDNRRTRRYYKTRYRKAKISKNRNSDKRSGRVMPTLESKIHTHEREIEKIRKMVPVSKVIIETAKFDTAALKDPRLLSPKVKSWGYQKGINYYYENLRMAVLDRDSYTCQLCKGKHKDHKLEVHHIIPRKQNGSDDMTNLITLCHTCHQNLHNNNLKITLKGKRRNQLRYASQMSIIRAQLLKRNPDFIETTGAITAANRKALGFGKLTHWLDASIIATEGKMPIFTDDIVYIKRRNPKGNFKRTKGKNSRSILPKGKVGGFLKYDKVMYRDHRYFILGRWPKKYNNYGLLMDIYGNQINFSYLPHGQKTPKLKDMKRLSARSSCMVAIKKMKL